ncbi:acyl-CoA reductase [Bacillus sp. EB600]|uniref:acyl-CoA reductase n=1 Tax=Bacillus sp. EB600 TaxID=2806345 RepID=UPI002108D8C7|nr:acyl-CoA reductase [Bacillus sp. EB600]
MDIEEISAYWLPKEVQVTSFREEIIEGSYRLKYPLLTGEQIEMIGRTVRKNRDNYLAKLGTNEIIEKIDQIVSKWLVPDYPLRKLAEALIPKITGYDAEMVRLELKRYIRTFRKKELLRFLDEEFDQPAILDEFRPRKSGGFTRAYGPKSIFHVFSGNVPGVQIWSLLMGLILKSANLGKTSISEPLFPVLFVRSLAEVDEKLADSIAILPWKGGTSELEEAAIRFADSVIVYGSDKAVDAIQKMVPSSKTFLHYGHKISLAVIGNEALTPDHYYETIFKVAEDMSVYDQQSCMSPQSVLVETGGAISPRQFAQMLAAELERYNKKRPRAKLSDEEAMSIHRHRHQYELQSFKDGAVSVYASQHDTSWTVIYHHEPGFAGSALNRTIHVSSSEELEADLQKIQPFEQYLQSCGIAVSPVRLFRMAEILGDLGVNRICSIGEMNRAKPGWHHDGRFNLLDLVRMVDIERNVEEDLEGYDPDVE